MDGFTADKHGFWVLKVMTRTVLPGVVAALLFSEVVQGLRNEVIVMHETLSLGSLLSCL